METKMHNRRPYREWTKEEMQFIIVNWKKMSYNELFKQLKVDDKGILASMVTKLRKEGFDLPIKSRNGSFKNTVKRLKKELKQYVRR